MLAMLLPKISNDMSRSSLVRRPLPRRCWSRLRSRGAPDRSGPRSAFLAFLSRVHCLNDVRPSLGFASDELSEFFGSPSARIQALRRELRQDARIFERIICRVGNLIDDRLGHACRSQDSEPDARIVAGQG